MKSFTSAELIKLKKNYMILWYLMYFNWWQKIQKKKSMYEKYVMKISILTYKITLYDDFLKFPMSYVRTWYFYVW